MSAPRDLDALFATWLRQHAREQPDDGDLAAFIAALPSVALRRAARLYARGFVRGCDFCTASERAQSDADLAAVAALVASLRAARALPPPESTD
jgi:hypothetical protein